ncbi:MAG: hypothetical protein IT165_10155 [Bryobacterales bacterium]|nr:hypothetical protein [Bryobacterales bacterium]
MTTKLGAEPKKLATLGVLALGAIYSFYTNVLSGPDIPQSAKSAPSARAVPGLPQPPSPAEQATQTRLEQRKMILGRQSVGEFRPTLKFGKDDRPDPMKVDPTLRLDLIAKLQNVTVEGGLRSLFDMGTAPPPKPTGPDPKIDIKKGGAAAKGGKGGVEIAGGTPSAPGAKPGDPSKPPPPAIPLKFYGYSASKLPGAKKQAFFLEGEDIFVVHEGDLIKRRYKVVKIGLNSVTVEDTQYKHQQTFPLEEPPANT